MHMDYRADFPPGKAWSQRNTKRYFEAGRRRIEENPPTRRVRGDAEQDLTSFFSKIFYESANESSCVYYTVFFLNFNGEPHIFQSGGTVTFTLSGKEFILPFRFSHICISRACPGGHFLPFGRFAGLCYMSNCNLFYFLCNIYLTFRIIYRIIKA